MSGQPPDSRIEYICQRCGNCCRWPGEVKVAANEIDAIAAFLGMDSGGFIQDHTRLRASRQGLALREKPGGECEFLDGIDCGIQPVKPRQCREFPNGWRFPGWRDVCEAIPVRVPADSAPNARPLRPTLPPK